MSLSRRSNPTKRPPESALTSEATRSTISNTKSGSGKNSPYTSQLELNLKEHFVYRVGSKHPEDEYPREPKNLEEILDRLGRRRKSLSASEFTDDNFRDFKQNNNAAFNEENVNERVRPLIEGEKLSKDEGRANGVLFTNFAHLTDGNLTKAKPDIYYGALPENVHQNIRTELHAVVVPTKHALLPIVPNCFFEVKGPHGAIAVAQRQATYDGALGARSMHELLSYNMERSLFDQKAYTISSIYLGGFLTIYAHHVVPPRKPGGRREYYMTQLRACALTDNRERFAEGAGAFRNAAEWAKEQLNEAIKLANERVRIEQGQNAASSQIFDEINVASPSFASLDTATTLSPDDDVFSNSQEASSSFRQSPQPSSGAQNPDSSFEAPRGRGRQPQRKRQRDNVKLSRTRRHPVASAS